jgi:hypothetical protein
MNVAYEFPEKAAYGKIMPKTKIYSYASPTNRVKELFVREVETITWAYKLSPKTINLPADGYVHEIQVMTIDLKGERLDHDVLATIDKAIPSPIFFILRYKNKLRSSGAFKRPSEADKTKRVISGYFETPWMKGDSEKQSLPIALNLKGLYHLLVKSLIPLTSGKQESIEELVERAERIQSLNKEAQKLETHMNSEKQFNRRVELHAQLGNIRKEITALS